MRIFLIFFTSIFLFANALTPDEAFNFKITKNQHFFNINFILGKKVFLYKNELKITKNNEIINNSFDLSNFSIKDENEVFFKELNFDFPIYTLNENDVIRIFYQGCSLEGLCYQPFVASFVFKNNELSLEFQNKEQKKMENTNSNQSFYEKLLKDSNFAFSLLAFFMYGFLLSLTPCTLPMVPIISSILVKSSGRNPIVSSVIYVLGMAISYTIAGVIAALLGSGVQAFFQNSIVIIAFSAFFVFLAFSMFGFYEIKMPNAVLNSLNVKISKLNGTIGIFLMGILSALIVGPCVAAPLAGLLVYIANSNDVILGASALFFMSLGMGIPLIAIGFGFKFITGNWMQNINKFFGFALLAVAIYFLKRVLDLQIINFLYSILGFAFVVYFKLFESAKNNFQLALKVLLVIVLAYSVVLFEKSIDYQENNLENKINFEKAKKTLELKDKNLIYFTANWCENCKIMSNTTFKNELVIKALRDFNLIKIDLTNPNKFEKSMAEKYKIFGPPVILFVDANGQVLKQIVGLIDANSLLKELEKLRF